VPCAGEPATLIFDNGKVSETAVLVKTNTTKVPDWADPPGADIDPYPRPRNTDECVTVDCSPGHPQCGVVTTVNTFDSGAISSLLSCFKRGFISLAGKRVWHGAHPWDVHDPNGCIDGETHDDSYGYLQYETAQGSPNQTKFLDKSWSGTIGWGYTSTVRWSVPGLDDPDVSPAPIHGFVYTYEAEVTSFVSVNALSGNRVRTFVKNVVEFYSIDGTEYTSADTEIWSARAVSFAGPYGTYNAAIGVADNFQMPALLAILGYQTKCHEPEVEPVFLPAVPRAEALTLAAATLTNGAFAGATASTHLTYSRSGISGGYITQVEAAAVDGSLTGTLFSISAPGATNHAESTWTDPTDGVTPCFMNTTYHMDMEVELSGENTAASVRDDGIGLLEQWDLTDRLQYPFRTDAHPRIAPLVARDEYPTKQSPEDIDALGDTYTDTTDHTGDIIGAPYGDNIDRFWNSLMEIYDTCEEVDFNCGDNYLSYYGAWSNDGAYGCNVPRATNWTTRKDACDTYPQSYMRYDTNGVFSVGVYLEVVLPWPSYNFARPYGKDRLLYKQATVDCGSDLPNGDLRFPDAPGIVTPAAILSATQSGGNVDIVLAVAAVLRDGDLVDFTGVGGLGSSVTVAAVGSDPTSTTNFTVAGTLVGLYTSGGKVVTHGAPAYYFDDSKRKAQFFALEWFHNFRDVGEALRIAAWQAVCHGADPSDFDCDAAGSGDPVRATQAGRGMPETVEDFIIHQDCLAWVKCEPIIIGFHPTLTSSSFPKHGGLNSAKIYAFPTGFLFDDRYGSLWQGAVYQSMADPLWETPATGGFFCPDPSTLSDCTPARVEAIADVPETFGAGGDEAPAALPEAREIHIATLSELQGVSVPDGLVYPPPSAGADADMPWLLINISACTPTGGGGEYAPNYNLPAE
jgi:hypothetical protein